MKKKNKKLREIQGQQEGMRFIWCFGYVTDRTF